METEVDFQNKDGKLLPGMFVQADVLHDAKKNALTVPVEADFLADLGRVRRNRTNVRARSVAG